MMGRFRARWNELIGRQAEHCPECDGRGRTVRTVYREESPTGHVHI
jgi:hypothetical protein